MQNNKIGLALGGGFLRGMAHIGVLQVLAENGIKPDMVAGTSSGSIIAGLYTNGWTLQEIEKLAVNIRLKDVYDSKGKFINAALMLVKIIFDVLHLPFPLRTPLGVMKGNNLESLLRRLFGNSSLRQAKIPLAITSVDLHSGSRVIFLSENFRDSEKKDIVYLRDVPVYEAVRASIAVPGVFEPKRIDQYLLVDGGVRENVPAEILKKLGADIVIAVDVGSDEKPCGDIGNLLQLLDRVMDIVGKDMVNRNVAENADVVIKPEMSGVGIDDFGKIPYCIEQGRLAAEKALGSLNVLTHNNSV